MVWNPQYFEFSIVRRPFYQGVQCAKSQSEMLRVAAATFLNNRSMQHRAISLRQLDISFYSIEMCVSVTNARQIAFFV